LRRNEEKVDPFKYASITKTRVIKFGSGKPYIQICKYYKNKGDQCASAIGTRLWHSALENHTFKYVSITKTLGYGIRLWKTIHSSTQVLQKHSAMAFGSGKPRTLCFPPGLGMPGLSSRMQKILVLSQNLPPVSEIRLPCHPHCHELSFHFIPEPKQPDH
jgi:hypothetical protein